jgi:hypothetical protein
MNFFAQDPLYANNMCAKFEGQKIYTKKEIHNLPTCVVVGNNGGNHFIATNFDTLRRVSKLEVVKWFFIATHVGRF